MPRCDRCDILQPPHAWRLYNQDCKYSQLEWEEEWEYFEEKEEEVEGTEEEVQKEKEDDEKEDDEKSPFISPKGSHGDAVLQTPIP